MIYDIYVGIDPSINSTGVSILTYIENKFINEFFFIIKPDKLTKKEKSAEEKYIDKFEYILYNKLVSKEDDNNTEFELAKTRNFINICNIIKGILQKYRLKYNGNVRFHICQEGISYGSITRTKSVFDLAGLNFMLRATVLSIEDADLTIGTPGEIKKFASGNGNANKEIMIELFKACHKDFDLPKLDDISDAYWMSKFAKIHTKI